MTTNVWNIASKLGILTGILSVIAIIRNVTDLGFSVSLELLVTYYNSFLDAFLGWAEPPLKSLLSLAGKWFGISLALDENWKQVFVLMWLYFSSDAKTNWQDRRGFAIFCIVLGGIISLLVSGFFGLAGNDSIEQQLIKGSIPIIGVLLWEFIREIWSSIFRISTPSYDATEKSRLEIFKYLLVVYTLPILLVGLLSVYFTWKLNKIGIVDGATQISLITVGIFVVFMALYWFGRGLFLATFQRNSGERWRDRLRRSGSTRFSAILLSVIGGVFLFLLLNAGLQLISL